jgi:hypothetical protein
LVVSGFHPLQGHQRRFQLRCSDRQRPPWNSPLFTKSMPDPPTGVDISHVRMHVRQRNLDFREDVTAIQALADAGDGCAGPPKPSILRNRAARPLHVCLTDGLYSEFAGTFSGVQWHRGCGKRGSSSGSLTVSVLLFQSPQKSLGLICRFWREPWMTKKNRPLRRRPIRSTMS